MVVTVITDGDAAVGMVVAGDEDVGDRLKLGYTKRGGCTALGGVVQSDESVLGEADARTFGDSGDGEETLLDTGEIDI